MRKLFSYLMFAILLSGAVAAWSWNRAEKDAFDSQIAQARAAAQKLERQIRIEGATGRAEVNGRGWPETVDPAWFMDDPPLNPFIPPGRPWVEIAAEDEDTLTDPPIRQSVTRDLAMFWYNPANGAVRARVGPMISDRRALDVYNRINGVNVPTLFDSRARLREVPMLSPAQERLLAGATSARKPPLIVVRHCVRPVEPEKFDDDPADIRTLQPGDQDPSEADARQAQGGSDAPARETEIEDANRRADHPADDLQLD